MNPLSTQGALTEAELDRLTGFLQKAKGSRAMNIEELDGFFASLIAGPEFVPPSEYLPELLGGKDAFEFSGLDEANEFLGLIMRHWNGIAATLNKGDVHLPLLLKDDTGVTQANDWSRGFVRGMDMRGRAWAELLNDEEQGGWMLPVLMLYHEHDENPKLRPGPIGPEKREKIIEGMAAGIVRAYRFFRTRREPVRMASTNHVHRGPVKTGRNDPCPCGSGKKYKRCCGGVTTH